MEQFGITLYYTNNHPDNGQPFFTEKELIQEAQTLSNERNDNEIIVTTAEAITYLQNQGYGSFHETIQYFDDCDITYVDIERRGTIQYFDDCDITYVDIERRGKSTTIVPHIKLKNINQTATLKTFLNTYDSLSNFTKMFIEQEKEVTLDGDWADIKETQETEDFNHLNEDGKYGFALGHAHALLNKYLYSPFSKLLKDYDLDVINDWFTYVQLKN